MWEAFAQSHEKYSRGARKGPVRTDPREGVRPIAEKAHATRRRTGAKGGSRDGLTVPRHLEILVFASETESYVQALKKVAPQAEIFGAQTLTEAEPHLEAAEIVFAWGLPPAVLARMPRLRWVQWLGAGVDLIVRQTPEDVVLTRVVGAFSTVMSEHVFAYLLALRRGIFEMRELQREHIWRRVIGPSLSGQRLGVAGLGSIGAEVARLGRAFGMEVWGLSRTDRGRDVCDRHFLPSAMREFAAGVDALVLVLPATPETTGIVDAEVLSGMREGSILVNVGRGSAIVERDLIAALRHGRPAMAQLDVFEREPLPPESPFWDLPNCYISSHCSGPSEPRLVQAFASENLRRYLHGEPLVGVVDRERGY